MCSKVPQDIARELVATTNKLESSGKGILGADESADTMAKRFEQIHVQNTEANRIAYREMLFTTKDMGNYISGVTMNEETLFQQAKSGKPLIELLTEQGIVCGIKVDIGVVTLPGTDNEKATLGLDKLAEKCQKYYNAGARFATWHAELSIDVAKGKPSALALAETAHTSGRFAAICQAERLVPIVEPELLCAGTHTIVECAEITERMLAAVCKGLQDHNVLLEGAFLKPSMVTPGSEAKPATHDEIGFYTTRSIMRTVPYALGGINFLADNQSEEDASLSLNAVNRCADLPCHMSFSYGRALQESCLQAWQGKAENVEAAQDLLLVRCQSNSEAVMGQYKSKDFHPNLCMSLCEGAASLN